MRSIPIGVLPTEGHVIRGSQIQSLITHCSPDASISAQLIAITTHYFYYRKHNNDFSYNAYSKYMKNLKMYQYVDWCQKKFVRHYNKYGTIPCDAEITFGAVINILFTETTLKGMLTTSIDLSGDVDSIAALTLGIGSLIDNVKNNLSTNLHNGLENGKYGYNYIKDLDDKMLKLYPRLNTTS